MNTCHIFKPVLFSLTFSLASVVSFAQTASVHDHNIFHGAGTAFVNTSPQAQAVGDGGVLRAQLIWQVTPGQTKGADLDIHAKLPSGQGAYAVTQFDPIGALPGTPQKTPPFGNPNTASDGNQQVNWVNRQVVFSNGQAVASLDQDNRTGVANAPTGKLVENIYLQGTTNPNYIPSGVYQFAVHNYNQTKLADPTASYAVWITTNGRVGARSTTHSTLYENTANPTQPAFYGTLTAEGQSSEIYGIEIITPAGETPHAPGITVVDAKRRYLNARLAAIRRQAELQHQQLAERTASQNDARIDWGGCPPPMVCQLSFLNANSTPMLIGVNTNAFDTGFNSQNLPQLNAVWHQNNVGVASSSTDSNNGLSIGQAALEIFHSATMDAFRIPTAYAPTSEEFLRNIPQEPQPTAAQSTLIVGAGFISGGPIKSGGKFALSHMDDVAKSYKYVKEIVVDIKNTDV